MKWIFGLILMAGLASAAAGCRAEGEVGQVDQPAPARLA